MDPIQEFLQSIGADAPGNGLPGGGVNGLRASTPGAPGLPGIDDAWRTRIPQGWVQFPDGSIGPPNPSSPIDSAWQTRVPTPQSPGGPLAPFAPPGSSVLNGGVAPAPVRGPLAAPAGPGGLPAGTGPQIMSPQGSNVGSGKEVGVWTNPFTDGKTIDPKEFAGGELPIGLSSLLGSANPYIKALTAAGGVLWPTPTASDDTISPEMAGQLPEHPHSTGPMPPVGPLGQPARPYTPTPRPMPSRPVTPTPDRTPDRTLTPPLRPKAASPRKKINPKSVDLGQVPRFTTVQYQVPNSTRNAPIYTALDLSRLFGGSK